MSKLKTVNLTPGTVHCVKTGTPLASIVGDGSEAVIRINGLLANGTIQAGNHSGHVRLTSLSITTINEKQGSKLPMYRWLTKPDGVWTQHEGWHIGEHNIAVLRAAGINPDPTTLTKGQVSRRTYGHQFSERIPKVAKPVAVIAAPMGLDELLNAAPIVPTPAVPVLAAVPTAPIAYTGPSNTLDLAPSHAELTYDGRGGYAKYKSRAVRGGWTPIQATQAWNEGRTAIKGIKVQATPIVAPPVPTPIYDDRSARHMDRVSQASEEIARRAPVVAPKVPTVGSTIQVTLEALHATLLGIEGATVTASNGTTFTVVLPPTPVA